MKIRSVAAIGLMDGGGAWPASVPLQDGHRVTVCLGGVTNLRSLVPFSQAQSITSNMYSKIGVRIDWRPWGHSCEAPGIVNIEFTIGTSVNLLPGALGFLNQGSKVDSSLRVSDDNPAGNAC